MTLIDQQRRRDFLKPVFVGPLTIGVAAADLSARTVDVAVIGAGLAGLTAARELRRHKIRLCVLEARDRVGGRTLDHSIGGGHVVEAKRASRGGRSLC